MYTLALLTAPTVEPVTVDQAKAHARIPADYDDEDELIATYITAARQYCETLTGRAFIEQTWRLSLDHFPGAARQGVGQVFNGLSPFLPPFPLWRPQKILLPRPKLLTIESITYLDLSGNRQTVDPSTYQLNLDGEPGSVVPKFGKLWPLAAFYEGSIQVTYTAGYGDSAGDVPASLQLAILELVAHWYENREATVLPTSGTGVVSVPLGFVELLDAETVTAFTYET